MNTVAAGNGTYSGKMSMIGKIEKAYTAPTYNYETMNVTSAIAAATSSIPNQSLPNYTSTEPAPLLIRMHLFLLMHLVQMLVQLALLVLLALLVKTLLLLLSLYWEVIQMLYLHMLLTHTLILGNLCG